MFENTMKAQKSFPDVTYLRNLVSGPHALPTNNELLTRHVFSLNCSFLIWNRNAIL